MEILNISKENALVAYKKGSPQDKILLENLFGTTTFVKSGNIIERIKCIEDVFTELNESYQEFIEKHKHLSPYKYAQELAEKITAAYNEGWWPTYQKGEKRWFPVFSIGGSGSVFSNSDYGYYGAFTAVGSALVFETEAKSNAAGKLFATTVYKDYQMHLKK